MVNYSHSFSFNSQSYQNTVKFDIIPAASRCTGPAVLAAKSPTLRLLAATPSKPNAESDTEKPTNQLTSLPETCLDA